MSAARSRIAALIVSAPILSTLGAAPREDRPMDALWADLENAEPEASRALLAMADRPQETVAFLADRLRPLSIDAEKVRILIDWLGSDDETTWKGAFDQLEYFDPRLAIGLETLMDEVRQAPARQRLVAILSERPPATLEGKDVNLRKFAGGMNFFDGRGSWWAEPSVARLSGQLNPKKKWVRAVRALALLEHIGTPEAVAILKAMASGHPDAQPTKVAVDVLARIERKGK